jgi:hypothetical protein
LRFRRQSAARVPYSYSESRGGPESLRMLGPLTTARGTAMRERIVSTLVYAREVLRDGMDWQECAHAGQYCGEDTVCEDCFYGRECQWLCLNDECVALQHRSLSALQASLEFAVQVLHSRAADAGHRQSTCRCDTCSWLRRAKHLLADVERRSVPESIGHPQP